MSNGSVLRRLVELLFPAVAQELVDDEASDRESFDSGTGLEGDEGEEIDDAPPAEDEKVEGAPGDVASDLYDSDDDIVEPKQSEVAIARRPLAEKCEILVLVVLLKTGRASLLAVHAEAFDAIT
jgi:hypothetical protein